MNLKDYIRGQRKGKEANQLERKAMDDPFLQDAIDGYDSVEGDHISVIENLEKRLPPPQKRINKRMWIWAAAAMIVLLIGIPLLLQLYKSYTKEEITIVSSDIISQEKESTTPSLQKDTVLVADHLELGKKEDSAPRAKQPTTTLSGKVSPETVELVAENREISEIERVSDKELRLSTVQNDIAEKMLIKEPQRNSVETLTDHVAGIAVSDREQDKSIRIRGVSSPVAQPDKMFVSGRIVDETGEPVAGATIILPNSRTGAITDTAGNFQLTVPKDEQGTLIASFIGMKSSEIPLKENVGDIKMKADDMAMKEVTVVAFGSQKKESVVGAVSAIKDTGTFDEEEFRNYFIENYDKGICEGQKIIIVVEFFIDPIGRPGNIDIKENPCPALESEIKRLLLGSPPWSRINRKVTFQIELP